MAALYGRLTGGRGAATRTGTPSSGMTATVQTWDAALTLRLRADGSFTLTQHNPSNGAPHKFNGKIIAEGTTKEVEPTVLTKADLHEISLVDNPPHPDQTIRLRDPKETP